METYQPCDQHHKIKLSYKRLDDGQGQILRSVSEYEFDGATPGLLTCSIGVAVFPEDARDVEELIEKADAALYQAKSKGKNSITSFSELGAKNPC